MRDRLLTDNAKYARTFSDGGLSATPARRLVVVTCMDARLDVFAFLGLHLGDAHVLRNAGGRVTEDVIRSLVVSTELLGTQTIAVIQHTDCGMARFTDDELRALVRERRGVEPSIEFHSIGDHAEAVRGDLEVLRTSDVLQSGLEVLGFVYDVTTGQLAAV